MLIFRIVFIKKLPTLALRFMLCALSFKSVSPQKIGNTHFFLPFELHFFYINITIGS